MTEAIRIVETHSGVNEVLGSAESVERMLEIVVRCLEAGRPGTRFPLVRLLARRGPISSAECDALSREMVRLGAAFEPHDVDALREPPPRADADPALSAAAPLDPVPEPFRRLNGNGAPRTLADAFAWPLFVVERVARLGSASRRGASIEAGDSAAFETLRTRLSPHSVV